MATVHIYQQTHKCTYTKMPLLAASQIMHKKDLTCLSHLLSALLPLHSIQKLGHAQVHHEQQTCTVEWYPILYTALAEYWLVFCSSNKTQGRVSINALINTNYKPNSQRPITQKYKLICLLYNLKWHWNSPVIMQQTPNYYNDAKTSWKVFYSYYS